MVSESTQVKNKNSAEQTIDGNRPTENSHYFPEDLVGNEEETKDYVEFQIFETTYPKNVDTNTPEKDRPKLAGTIMMHIPEGIQQPNSAQWESQTLDTGVSGLANFDIGALLLGGGTQWTNFIGEGLGDRSEQRGGRAQNANKFLLFNGINFRSFQFQYEIIPKSLNESKKIHEIIKLFRIGMLPDKKSTTYYDIPYTFMISYSDTVSKSLHKFKPAVLTECNITYGADGKFSLTTSDYPTNISLQLTFQETEQVTRSDVLEGF